MALTKEVIIDQITITENGVVMLREVTRIMEDTVELSKQYHRTSFAPESDISMYPQNVQDICKVVWTPEIIAAYKTAQENISLPNGVIA